MRRKFPSNRRAITIGVILAGLAAPVVAQDGEIEEVVVTGSFIRGSALDAPSPVQVVDRESIEAQGAAIIWDVIKNLEVNSGSFTNSGSGERSQTEGTAQVNLRNLGENSTLTLINGKRMAPAAATTTTGGEFVDINSIPLVMTERVEILTDGGSALYGADAVAGVVNIIMRTDFEGLEVYGDIQSVESESGAYDQTVSGIWGWASDDGDTHFVISAERFERDNVSASSANFIDENTQFTAATSTLISPVDIAAFGTNINPAYFRGDIVADNIANGGNGSGVYSDPLCTTQTGLTGIPYFVGNLREEVGERGGTCNEDVERFNFLSRDTERSSFAMAFDHTFSEAAEFYSFVNYSENEIILEGGGLNNTGGSAATRGPTVFLAQPGSTTPIAALQGFGINAGVGSTMELGYFAPNIGLARPTAAGISNAPVSLANGGPNVAFLSNARDGIPRDGQRSNSTQTNSTLVQAGLRGDFEFTDRAWNYDVSVSWSATSNEQEYTVHNRRNTELAANGLGGPNCTPNGVENFDFGGAEVFPGAGGFGVPSAWDFFNSGYTQTFFPGFVLNTRETLSLALTSNNQGQGGCEFYNPFLSAQTGGNVGNSPELLDWMTERVLRADKRNKLMVFDALVGGEFMDMAGGPAAIAFGAQYRERNTTSRAPEISFPGLPNSILGYDANGVPDEFHYVSNNFECSSCIFNFDNTRDTSAAFVELSLPFIENVETQIAVRYEDYGGNIGSEVSPKIAMSWRPMDSLIVRGSFSQSFRAPNIDIIEQGLEAGSVIFKDPISNQRVRAGLDPAITQNGETEQSFTLGGPAPNVGNESADTFSAGFIWTPGGRLEGLSVQADAWRFEVSDRVLPQPPISALAPEIAAFNAVVNDPNSYILNDSISSDSPVLDVACDPNALEASFGRDSAERLNCVVNPDLYAVGGTGFGISRSARNEDADLITLTLTAINAGQIEADGIDIKLGYDWENDWGRWRASMDYTHVNQYDLIGVPGLELGLLDTGKFDAAGTTGDSLLVRSLPDNKGNITLTWQRDRHGVTVTNRHIGSYQDLAYDNVVQNANPLVRSLASTKIDSYATWDMQYRYSHDWGNSRLGTTNFSVGLLDMFDETVPFRETTGGSLRYDATVFDPRGRRLYARALWSF
ncbi:MAG: iron complex outermembrane receptor protein [Pseudohongiellaceae bacterium]|jgi:iron complex outermembrane receptor protein